MGSGWDIFLNFFWDIPRIFLDYLQIIWNFLYDCQSVSWLTSLLKLSQYRDISTSGWNIFLKFFVDIPDMFVHYFQMLKNFLHVCQSVSWLISIIKLGKYRYISSTGWNIFLKIFGGFPGINLQLIQIILNFLYVCQSVSWLTSLLKLG